MGLSKILIVDDEPDVEVLIRQKFRREIKEHELEFVFAADGQDALDIYQANPDISIALTDINMPRMDGLTLLSKLKEQTNPPATVVVSAYGDMRNIRTAMNNGAFDFLIKPIEFDDLQLTLQRTLAHVKRISDLATERSQALQMQTMLSQYFSPSVVNAMVEDPDSLAPRAERREGTFMFTDLQDFLRLVEGTKPQDVLEMVNEYLDGITRLVFEHDGTVMKIVGDGVYAAFGAPEADPKHARKAVDCATAIDRFAQNFRTQMAREGLNLGVTRIGVHTGEALIGRFGGEQFFDYAAYGTAVNHASRLEAANKTLGTRVCISKTTVDQSPEFRGRSAGNLIVKGSDVALPCFEPVTIEEMDDACVAGYQAAFDKLQNNHPGAKAAFAALIGTNSDDELAAFHLGRILRGESGVEVKV